MIKALQLVLVPFATWQKIVAARRSVVAIILAYLIPLFVVGLATEGVSLATLGETRPGLASRVQIPVESVIRYAGTQFAVLFVSIVIGAQVLVWVARSSHLQTSFTPCFTLLAYGFSPILLMRILDAAPQINTWVCLALGVLASLSVLYHGVALTLKPDQTKGFGIYLISIIFVVVSSSFAHLMAQFVLRGRIAG